MKSADIESKPSVMWYTCDRCGEETKEKHINGWTELITFVTGLNNMGVRHLCSTCGVELEKLFDA